MPLEGLQLGRYRFIRLLGSGGMGEVYLAEDPRINQQVAIKVIRAEASPYPDYQATKEASRLFQREAIAVAKLDHPHILPLFDYGEVNLNGTSLTYLVMPYRPEGSLVEWLHKRGTAELLSPLEVAQIISQTAEALQHAHDRQIIHQDVKPSNLLIRERREDPDHPDILLADFGIARSTTATSSTSQVIRGTPTYMAPEQWEGHPVFATDQYALAIMAYELLTGRPPFQGGSVQMMYQHLNTQPQPPSTFSTRLSADVDIVLLHALAKKYTERFASVAAFANAFQQAVQSNEVSNSALTPSPLGLPISLVEPMTNVTDSGTGTHIINSRPPIESQIASHITTPFQSDDAETSESTSAPAIKLTPGKTSTNMLSTKRTGEVAGVGKDTSNVAGGTGLINSGLSTGSNPPTSFNGGPHRRKGRRLLAVALIVLAVLLISGSIVYAMPGGFSSLIGRVFGTPSAVVTITPKNTDLKKLYTIPAVMGTPDVSLHQVQARQLSYKTTPQSQTANATGVKQLSATQATGILTFYVNPRATETIPAGTVFVGSSGIQVATDKDILVNGSGPNAPGTSVTAHAVQPGARGNIPLRDIDQPYNNLIVRNDEAFTGGQDAQTLAIVQQSDINGAANALVTANTPDPKQELQPQIHENERLIGTPSCIRSEQSDHVAGDQANSVTVTVTFTCTGEVYDQQGALSMAVEWLKQDAAKSLGAGYTLVGKVVAVQPKAPTLNNDQTLSVPVTTYVVWVFQFNNAQQQALAKLIVGKKKEVVQSLLLQQPGIAQVHVQLTSGDGVTFPSDSTQIKFVILDVNGK